MQYPATLMTPNERLAMYDTPTPSADHPALWDAADWHMYDTGAMTVAPEHRDAETARILAKRADYLADVADAIQTAGNGELVAIARLAARFRSTGLSVEHATDMAVRHAKRYRGGRVPTMQPIGADDGRSWSREASPVR